MLIGRSRRWPASGAQGGEWRKRVSERRSLKTYKNLYPQVYSFDNLYTAYRAARRGKRDKGQVSAFLDPTISPEKRKRGDSTTSVAIILACRPYHWKDQFSVPITLSAETKQEIMAKWHKLFSSL